VTLLALALDTPDAEEAVRWAKLLASHVDVMKVGLELFVSAGPDVVRRVVDSSERPVFLDLKLDDIPRTVAGAARAASRLGIDWLTVHTAAGEAACAAAAEAAREVDRPPRLLGVTVLTSLGQRDLKATGMTADLEAIVDRRARLAAAVGMEGVVCAGTDLSTVAQAAPVLERVVPGVRRATTEPDDQSRVVTAAEAAAAGASMIVVGRGIVRAPDPVRAAVEVREELASARAMR